MVVENNKQAKKRGHKTARNTAPNFIHAKQLEIDFFAKKCLKTLLLHPEAPI